MSTIDPDVDAHVASVDDVGPDQPPNDKRIEEQTIACAATHRLPTPVTSGDSPQQLVLKPVAFLGIGNNNIHTVALDLPHLLSTNFRASIHVISPIHV
jgi:hypothetical protein